MWVMKPNPSPEAKKPMFNGIVVCGKCRDKFYGNKLFKCLKCSDMAISESELTKRILSEVNKMAKDIVAIPPILAHLREIDSELRAKAKDAIEKYTGDDFEAVLKGYQDQRAVVIEQISEAENALKRAQRLVAIPTKLTKESALELVEKVIIHARWKIEIEFRRKIENAG
jgi:hypothetical protein